MARPNCLLVSVFFAALSCIAEASFPPPSTEQTLAQFGLPMDAAFLTECLQKGLPEELRKPDGAIVEERWGIYGLLPEVLVELKAAQAVPTLATLLCQSLPEPLQKDLRAHAAKYRDDERERESARQQTTFQSKCAETLGTFGDAAAIPALKEFLARMIQSLHTLSPSEENLIPAYDLGFYRAGIALASLGDTAGVDAAIDVMSLPGVDPWESARLLKVVTLQPYGPKPGAPASMRARELARWTAWWKENKGSFHPDRRQVLARTGEPYVWLDPEDSSLRGKLELIYLANAGPNGGLIQGDEEWMQAHGEEHCNEFAAVMEDADETYNVRKEAMRWYARFGGEAALKSLERYIRWEVSFDPADEFARDYLCQAAFELVSEHAPDRAYALSVQIIENGGHLSGYWAYDTVKARNPKKALDLARKYFVSSDRYLSAAAVSLLMEQDPKGAKRVARRIKELPPYAQGKAVELLLAFDTPEAEAILAAALASPDPSTVRTAMDAIRTHNAASTLCPELKAVFQRIDADPRYRP